MISAERLGEIREVWSFMSDERGKVGVTIVDELIAARTRIAELELQNAELLRESTDATERVPQGLSHV